MVQFEFELIGIDEQIYDNFKTFTLELEAGNMIKIGKVTDEEMNNKNIYSTIYYNGHTYLSIEDSTELSNRLIGMFKKEDNKDFNALDEYVNACIKDLEKTETKFEKMKSKKNKIVYIQFVVWGIAYLVSLYFYTVYDADTTMIILLGVISILLKQLDRELIK